ncbi:MAG TPA: AI-2E family transporter [Patescibacteria group bacterium]|nr:AI-2E family transporter [Patescibacteria group bacterium]
MNQVQHIEISPRTLLTVLGILVGIWFLWQIKGIIVLLFVSYILMSAISPIVDRLQKKGLPRALSVLVPFLVIILSFVLLAIAVVPSIQRESNAFIAEFGQSYKNLVSYLASMFNISDLKIPADTLGQLPQQVVQVGINTVSSLFAVVTVAVLTFYMLLEKDHLYDQLFLLTPRKDNKLIEDILARVEKRLGTWVRGQLLLMCVVGLMTWVGLTLLGIRFSFALALIAGFLELIPIIGPIVSAVPAVIIAMTVSPLLGLLTTLLYIVIQQLENHLLVPKVMEKAVDLSPLVIIISLMIGGKLFGLWGALLAVPIVAIIHIILSDIRNTQP